MFVNNWFKITLSEFKTEFGELLGLKFFEDDFIEEVFRYYLFLVEKTNKEIDVFSLLYDILFNRLNKINSFTDSTLVFKAVGFKINTTFFVPLNDPILDRNAMENHITKFIRKYSENNKYFNSYLSDLFYFVTN